jgi:hypothetical protein
MKIISPEQKAKISASLMGRKKSPETRARMKAAQAGRKLSAEHCEKISQFMTDKFNGPEGGEWRRRLDRTGTRESEAGKRARSIAMSGEKHWNWQGGERPITNYGYRIRYAPGRGVRNQAFEHRLIAEKAIGRLLKKGEVVHHVNGNKLDNRNSNLLICSASYHHVIEARMAALYKAEHFSRT